VSEPRCPADVVSIPSDPPHNQPRLDCSGFGADRGDVIGSNKSVIRTERCFLRESVTGEFYARVTVLWVTLCSTAAEGPPNKPAGSRWLRSS